MGYIYILTSPSGKSYIGQTIRSIAKRFNAHRLESSRCAAISNAIQKYGWKNFEKDWYECPDEDLNFDEDLLIREMGTLYPDGYNLTEGGGNGKPSEETRQKQRKAHLGKTMSITAKKNMSESRKGNKNHNSKKVYQYDLEGNLLRSFESSGEAALHINKNGSHIRTCARGIEGHKTAYGFKWSYTKYN